MAKFKNIGLYTKHCGEEAHKTLCSLSKYLHAKNLNVFVEEETATSLKNHKCSVENLETLGKKSDLIIVVGGDGSLLNASRIAATYNVPILGINRGKLGFLTDINPHSMKEEIDKILAGEFFEEKRFLLEANIPGENAKCKALNEVVYGANTLAKMLEFEVYVDDLLMCSYVADGIIIATPTGSTAYALSSGAPILHPTLDAIVLAPMFSHTLTSRPIVINGNSKIKIKVPKKDEEKALISCDSHINFEINPGEEITVKKSSKKLRLIHPLNYDYYKSLRSKLHWGGKLYSN